MMKSIAIATAFCLLCALPASAEEGNKSKEKDQQDTNLLLALAGLGAIGGGVGAAIASNNGGNGDQQRQLLTTILLTQQSHQ